MCVYQQKRDNNHSITVKLRFFSLQERTTKRSTRNVLSCAKQTIYVVGCSYRNNGSCNNNNNNNNKNKTIYSTSEEGIIISIIILLQYLLLLIPVQQQQPNQQNTNIMIIIITTITTIIGLAGFPFAGNTGLRAMAAHILMVGIV